ncbi:Unconventional myosin-X [Holothuria leucospilota]|uniref:Unconventional myosin-X n=1 Tax=Holothuria leucospilota TaxID=206669 RepID=A0A9Q1BEZ8_HOLLE|nr:Unconventional myosin-X [Holothuria leucospilota]
MELLSKNVGLEDMAKLMDLHDKSILENLKQRHESDLIYTYIGSILVAINPYKQIHGLYEKSLMQEYNHKNIGELPPHIFAIANDSYYSMWKRNENQCVLISGESGAGKTESTKFILNFLSVMSQGTSSDQSSSKDVRVEENILQSSPILEAFGNAKTIYNNNSSRFGKFIQLHFSQSGSIEGGKIRDYLLEKNRVVGQNPGERNYHVFYALMAGAEAHLKEEFGLTKPTDFFYLNKSGCIDDPSLDDKGDFQRILNAFRVMKFSEEQIKDVLQLLAAILHVGNLEFITAGGAQVSNGDALLVVANLLGVDDYQLHDALTQKTRVLRGEVIATPLDVDQAADSRDSLAMNLYGQCFKWIIRKINNCIRGEETFCSIGVLDIFGFENFEVNRFEQFNINFANEKLQEYFNKHIFSLEQHEYNTEGLPWVDIDWQDNGECLDLIEKKLGIISLVNEESRFPKGTDETMLTKLHTTHAKNSFYIKPKVQNIMFGIHHYAGEVFYTTTGFLEKNRDTFRDDILCVLKESRSDFVYDLFETMTESEPKGGRGGGKTMRNKPTVSSQFKESLHALMTTLNACNPYFVRCIKPNAAKAATCFKDDVVINQLRYSGMLETVKIRKAGFPVRRYFEDFLQRYKVLVFKDPPGPPPSERCKVLLSKMDADQKLWQIGKSKVFLKEIFEMQLEGEREVHLSIAATLLKAHIRGYIARKAFKLTVKKIILVESFCKMFLCRRRFVKIRNATIVFQKYERARVARRILAELKEEKRKEEERLREEQRKREELLAKLREEKRREEERLRLEEEKRRQEEEERRKQEELIKEEQKRKEEEEKRKQEEAASTSDDAHYQRSLAFLHSELVRVDLERRKAEEKLRELEELTKRLEEEARIQKEAEELERQQKEEQAKKELERARQIEIHRQLEREEQERMAEEERLQKEIEELKRQEELNRKNKEEEERRLYDEEHGDQLKRAEELVLKEFEDSLLQFEEEIGDIEEDAVSRKSDEGQNYEGFLLMKSAGMINTWKKRWFVLKDETLMYFRSKQEALKSGWLYKKGGGHGTLSRRNWKKRFFVLKDTTLKYYDHDGDNAKQLGAIDVKTIQNLIDSSVGRENSLEIITNERTFQFVADSADDCSEWYSILTRVKSANPYEMRELRDEEANPKNAIGSLDVVLIDSVVPVNIDSKKNAFSIITAERVVSLAAESPEEMNNWLTALTIYHRGKRVYKKDEILQSGWLTQEIVRGPLGRGVATRKKRYFVLTQNSLDIYHDVDLQRKVGAVALSSLCSVTVPDDKAYREEESLPPPSPKEQQETLRLSRRGSRDKAKPETNDTPNTDIITNGNAAPSTNANDNLDRFRNRVSSVVRKRKSSRSGDFGQWQFTVHSRTASYNLYTNSSDSAWQWTYAIQDVIDSKPPFETPFQILMKEIHEASVVNNDRMIDRIYKFNPILRNTPHPMKAPLLPLPYGQILSSNNDKGYTTLHEEAIRIFTALQGSLESIPDPLPIIQGILQTCHDLKLLRDEVYCQVAKQTTQVDDPDSLTNLRNWQIMACMASAFLPSRNILRYIRFHIKRSVSMFPDSQMAKYAEYTADSLKRTKTREFVPCRDEIISILGRRDMKTTVHCHGGGSCEISINSSTTAGHVVRTLVKGLNLEDCLNKFALFERSGMVERAIENRMVVADVLARFERYKVRNLSDRGHPWQLFFKLSCFVDTENVDPYGLEYSFMYEQAHEDVIQQHYPASDETLIYLAALRMQCIKGDYEEGDWIRNLGEVYPVDKIKETQVKKDENEFTGFPVKQRKENVITGTLRGLGEKTLKRLQKSASDDTILDSVFADEISAMTSDIVDKWKQLRGMQIEDAQQTYMNVIKKWEHYGTRLFDVESKNSKYPSKLWLAVGAKMVAIHQRGEAQALEEIPYEKILSFGAPIPNEYKIVMEGMKEELTFETNEVIEIAKLMKAYINEIVHKRQNSVFSR